MLTEEQKKRLAALRSCPLTTPSASLRFINIHTGTAFTGYRPKYVASLRMLTETKDCHALKEAIMQYLPSSKIDQRKMPWKVDSYDSNYTVFHSSVAVEAKNSSVILTSSDPTVLLPRDLTSARQGRLVVQPEGYTVRKSNFDLLLGLHLKLLEVVVDLK